MTESANDQVRRRREELAELRARGVEPYPYGFEVTAHAREVLDTFRDDGAQRTVQMAGRLMTIRRMGKATFAHLQDASGRIQIYLRADELPAYDDTRLYDIGDIVGVTGFVFRTRMGEITVHVQALTLLCKSLHPIPTPKEETDETGATVVHDAFTDKEQRYRQRELDLIVNPGVRETFAARARVISTIRRFLDGLGMLEVETPVLQSLYGGAYARPFRTHHHALDVDLYLRIADELYLKRLLVGGFDAVYEISKDFRNEGMDKRHNPEFTMLECYVAYRDYRWMMDLVEALFGELAREVVGADTVRVGEREIALAPPFARVSMLDAIKAQTGRDVRGLAARELRAIAAGLGVAELPPDAGVGKIVDEIFSTTVEPYLVAPTFIIDYPVAMSPLAKAHRTLPDVVERFELIVNGVELANCFTELNDPIEQRRRLEEQARLRAKGDEEAMTLDEDFLRALEIGMPPAAGLGIGIDRLVMLLTGQESIRDVVLFPAMRPL